MSRSRIATTTLAAIVSLLLLGSVTQAATVLFPSGGGLGTSTPPTYGQVPVGNGNGTYSLVATSSLGISGTGGGSGSATTTIITQTSHGFSVGQWVGLATSTYALTNAVPGGVYQSVGIVTSVPDANHFVLQTSGDFTDTNLIPGMSYYLSASSTALGTIVGYPPATAGYLSAPVAVAKSQTTATINIGRPSVTATSNYTFGMNVGWVSSSTALTDLALLDKNLANKRVRFNIPTYSDSVSIYEDRYLVTLFKSHGYYVTYGITGLGGVQNSTTYNAWKAQVPSEAAWAAANGVDEFYIGNEEDWQAQIGNFGGGITGDGVRNDVRALSSTVKSSYPSMRVVYSTAQGTVAQWGAFNGDYGALDGLGFNMYDTQANFRNNIVYFTGQIGPKYFVSEWAANFGHYDMIHSHGYTDAMYAADLAYRAGVIQSFGLNSYFFSLHFGNNTDATGNYNILLNTGVLLPGAVSAFGGANGNAVQLTPLLLTDGQKLYFNSVGTSYLTSDSTNFNVVAPAFGSLAISGRTYITSTQTPQLKVAYDGSNYLNSTISSSGKVTFDANGSGSGFAFLDKLAVSTSTPFAQATLSLEGSDPSIYSFDSDSPQSASRPAWKFGANGTQFNIFSLPDDSTPLLRLVITANGNIGVGSSSPYAQFSIAGASGNTTDIFALSTSTASATTTAVRISQNGNLHLMNGAGIDIGEGVTPGGNNILIQGVASTTALTVSGLPNCNTTSALITNSSGVVSCGSIGGGGAAFPFTPTTNFGVNTSATSTPLNATAGIFASSTSQFLNANFYGNVGVGSTTPWKLLSVGTSNAGSFAISTSTAGCAQFSALGELFSTGVTCGTGGSSSSFTPTINFGVNTSATSTVLNATAGIFASSTSHFVNADFAPTSPVQVNDIGGGTNRTLFTVSSTTIGSMFSVNSALITTSQPVVTIGSNQDGNFKFTQSGGGSGELQMYYLTESTPRVAIGRDMLGNGIPGFVEKSGSGGTIQNTAVGIGTPGAGRMGFYASNLTSLIERGEITATGMWGIGTTTPVANLQVTAAANSTTTLEIGRAGQNKGSCVKLYDSTGVAWYYTPAPGTGALTSASASSCASVAGF